MIAFKDLKLNTFSNIERTVNIKESKEMIKIKFSYILSANCFKFSIFSEANSSRFLSCSQLKQNSKSTLASELYSHTRSLKKHKSSRNMINRMALLNIKPLHFINQSKPVLEEHPIEINFTSNKYRLFESRTSVSYISTNSQITLSYEVEKTNAENSNIKENSTINLNKIDKFSENINGNLKGKSMEVIDENDSLSNISQSVSDGSLNTSTINEYNLSNLLNTKEENLTSQLARSLQVNELISGFNSSSKINDIDRNPPSNSINIKFSITKNEFSIENTSKQISSEKTMCISHFDDKRGIYNSNNKNDEDFKHSKFLSTNDTNSFYDNKIIPTKQIHSTNELKVPDFEDFKIISNFEEQLCNPSKLNDFKENMKHICESFFVSGPSFSNSKIVANSENLKAPCDHPECSMLPGLKPSILYRFAKKDYKSFELNDNITSFCFPDGLKLCYEQNETKISSIKNFQNLITNLYGERMYIINYHFYKKYDFVEYQKHFVNSDPIREFIKSRSLIITQESSRSKQSKKNLDLEKKYTRELDICYNLLNNDYVYIPYCFSMISKLPNSKEFEKILEVIIKLIESNKQDNFQSPKIKKLLEDILIHTLYEVPEPTPNSVVNFYLPYNSTYPIQIKSSIFKNIPKLNYDADILFNYFSVENIILIHSLMLFEQKVLFITNKKDYSILLPIIESFVSLLYPLKWVHVYIPVLPQDSLIFLQSFMPFLIGIDCDLIPDALKFIENNCVYIVDIFKNTVTLTAEKKVKKIDLKTLWKYIPKLPMENFEFLSFELKNLKNEFDDLKNSIKKFRLKSDKKTLLLLTELVETEFRRAFIKSMAILYGDFIPFTSNIDGVTYFNQNSFVACRSSGDIKFFEEFLQTQNFKQFLQASMNHTDKIFYFYFDQLCQKYRFYISHNANNNNNNHSLIDTFGTFFKLNRGNNQQDKRIKFIIEAFKSDPIDTKENLTRGVQPKLLNIFDKIFYSNIENESTCKNFLLVPFFFTKYYTDEFECYKDSEKALISKINQNIESVNSEKIFSNICQKLYDKMNPFKEKRTINESEFDIEYLNSTYENETIKSIKNKNFDIQIFEKILLEEDEEKNNLIIIRKYDLKEYFEDKINHIIHKQNSNHNFNKKEKDLALLFSSENLCYPTRKLNSEKALIQKGRYNHLPDSVNDNSNIRTNSKTHTICYLQESYNTCNTSDQIANILNKTKITKELNSIKEKREKILHESELKEKPMSYMSTSIRRKQSILKAMLNPNTQTDADAFQIQINDMIKDYMELLLTSESTHDSFDDISSLFHSRYARSKFAKILYQDKFKENNPHCLNKISFDELFKIICNALQLCEREISQFEDIRLITKSTLYYYRLSDSNTGSNCFLNEEFSKKKRSFLVWKHLDFWRFYVDSELTEIGSYFSSDFETVEDFYFTTILNVVLFMYSLNLDFYFIQNSFVENVVKNYLNPESTYFRELLNKISKLER